MKTIRNCCSCLVVVVVLVIAVLCALGWALTSARTAHAQTNTDPALCGAFGSPASAIPITAAIPLSRPNTVPRDTFFSRPITLTWRSNECIVMAATPDGRDPFWVDDAMFLQIVHANGTTARWTRDFRNADHTQVIAIPPQNLSALFAIGENWMTVTLQDLSPNVFGSSALWLVIFALPSLTATVSSTLVPTVVTQTPAPIFTPTLVPTPTPIMGIPAANAAPAVSSAAKLNDSIPIIPLIAGGALFLLVVGLVAVRARQPATPELTVLYPGTLTILDETTFESTTIELADWTNSVEIWADPLRLQVPKRNGKPPIRATPCADGLRIETDNSSDPMLLRHGDGATIGKLKLTLENDFGGEQ